MRGYKKRRIKLIRYIKRIRRKKVKKKKRRIVNKKYKTHKKYKPHIIGSKLLAFLIKKKFYKPISYARGKVTINIPKIFSFSENAKETIDVLKKIVYAGTCLKIKDIHFNHTKCETLGLCASTVMDVLLIEIEKYRKLFKREYSVGGRYGAKKDVKDILEVSGVLKHLGFRVPDKEGFEKLELIECGESGYVAEKVSEYFSKCLDTQGFSMKKEGTQMICELIGEVIDNCGQHGGPNSKWYTIGHFFSNNKKKFGECHLVIFNFGQTIYESIKAHDTTKQMKIAFNKMTKKHRGYFKKNKWNEESLWTIYALQDGISRLRHKKHDPDRGSGTFKLMNQFKSIGKNKHGNPPIMSITSGNINIYLDEKYDLKELNFGKNKRHVIAFNEENNLYRPADENSVRITNNEFPGVVISMKFFIDREYIKKLMEERRNED